MPFIYTALGVGLVFALIWLFIQILPYLVIGGIGLLVVAGIYSIATKQEKEP